MDCPNCGVYNPEGRERCWRCDTVLPKQALPPRRRTSSETALIWLYVSIALFALVTILRMCGTLLPPGPPAAETPTSYHFITLKDGS